jgi:hypothetical protein
LPAPGIGSQNGWAFDCRHGATSDAVRSRPSPPSRRGPSHGGVRRSHARSR